MITASDMESLMETVYLLRSPANAERLLSALSRALEGGSSEQSLDMLKHKLNIEFPLPPDDPSN